MNLFSRKFSIFVCTLMMGCLSGFYLGEAQAKCAKSPPGRAGEVYLIRGLANVFSLGLDQYSKDFTRSGIQNCIFNHRYWKGYANDIVERHYKAEISFPIVIIGHSLGANVTPDMANFLASHNIKVRYIAMLDPVKPTAVGKNIAEVINFYIPGKKEKRVIARDDFDGLLDNVDLSIWRQKTGHFDIDVDPEIKSVIHRRVLELTL